MDIVFEGGNTKLHLIWLTKLSLEKFDCLQIDVEEESFLFKEGN